MADRLQDRLCLITGASRGIGRAVAKKFAAEGAHVIALARTEGALVELDDEIREAGGKPATLIVEDITDSDKVDQIGAALFERFGRLDVLVSCAGIIGSLTPVNMIKPKDWDAVLKTNLTAQYRLIRSFDPLLRASSAGRAIFPTSRYATGFKPYWAAYAVAQAGLETMVRMWAHEVHNVSPLRVNLIDPGPVDTNLRAKAFPGEDETRHPSPDQVAEAFLDLAVPEFTEYAQTIRFADRNG
ncbi:SDR family NAD(P)-dependent oxidoreductase [Phaeovibrio sulfidiphilus]|uniref:SDR family NAD(P)-dependent oxidoreductase n=1 Tax=Phaeovibrio sulfidiphilus TaxID=1220600 RepID=A0A8J6YND8_9PROT|nr:SDR family NAD(P)-dependent oxidoreductase [Phaeovibrio sulfidiphilus]MBE1236521.1 SDR family NAD(P)-dependent oxidoreductase [Phaeovibrio sulfidiphilus]